MRRLSIALLVGACAGASTPRPASSSEASARSLDLESSRIESSRVESRGVEWSARRGSIVCRATGTEIPLPGDAALLVRDVRDDAVLVVRGGPVLEAALLVDQGRGDDASDATRERWAILHEVITGAPLGDLAVTAEIRRGERGEADIVAADYEADGDHYRLALRTIRRNGATCRLAALERSSPTSGALVAALDAIIDAPGLEIPGPSVPRARDAGWDAVTSVVDGVFAVAEVLGALLR